MFCLTPLFSFCKKSVFLIVYSVDKKVNLTKNELKIMSFMAKNKTNLITKTMCEDVLDID